MQSWLDLNPEFEYWFWTDEDINQFVKHSFPQIVNMFQRYPSNIYRSDAFRYSWKSWLF